MLDWIYPVTVEKVISPVNGQIKIVKSRGRYSVWVSGFEQSGPMYVEKLWRNALKGVSLSRQKDSLICVLVLGLGCGTTVPLILDKWPKAKIIGVEIDPTMIELGKKYFGLGQIPKLYVIKQDANKFIKSTKQKFNLILVDAYIANRKVNVLLCRNLLTKNGLVIINNLVGLKNELVLQ